MLLEKLEVNLVLDKMNRQEALFHMSDRDKKEYSKLSNEAIELKLAYTYNIKCKISDDALSEPSEVKE